MQFWDTPFDFEQVFRDSQEAELGPDSAILVDFGPNSAWDMVNAGVQKPGEDGPDRLNWDREEREDGEITAPGPLTAEMLASLNPIEEADPPIPEIIIGPESSAAMNVDVVAGHDGVSVWDTAQRPKRCNWRRIYQIQTVASPIPEEAIFDAPDSMGR